MTGKQFVREWDRGAFKGDMRPEITHVESLLPFVR
jgi:hypothetical protein